MLNRTVDSFFTNQEYKDDDNKGTLQAFATFYKSEGDKLDQQYDLKVKIDLPRTTKRLKIVIEKEQDDIRNALSDENLTRGKTLSKSKTGGKITSQTTSANDSKYGAGLDFLMTQSRAFTSLLHFGVRLDLPLNPSIKLDLEKEIKYKYFTVGLMQKFNVYRQEGFQEVSQVTVTRKWTDKIQTDLINNLVWSDELDVFILRNGFIYSQQVGEEKSLSYSAGANARLSPAFSYESYDTSISYRQLVYSNWLYGSLTLGIDFVKAYQFNDDKFVQVRLEMFFK